MKKLTPDQEAFDLLDQLHRSAADQKISHYKIAETMGVSQPGINRALTGKHFPRLDSFVRLCRALGVQIKLVPK